MSSRRTTYAGPYEAWLTPNQASKTTSGGGEIKHRYLRCDLTCAECDLDIDTTPQCPFSAEEYNLPRKENPACMAFVLRSNVGT